MLDGGYAGGAELVGKLTVHRLFALDLRRRLSICRWRRGRVSASLAHVRDDSDDLEVQGDVLTLE
jgi:hypothetical protein